MLSPATIQTETISQSGDYRRWVLSNYRAASFGSFVPQDINDRVYLRKGVTEVSFRVGSASFSRRFRQKGEKVTAGFHEFLNEVMRDLNHAKRFYKLAFPSRAVLHIVCVTPSTYEDARAIGLVPGDAPSA